MQEHEAMSGVGERWIELLRKIKQERWIREEIEILSSSFLCRAQLLDWICDWKKLALSTSFLFQSWFKQQCASILKGKLVLAKRQEEMIMVLVCSSSSSIRIQPKINKTLATKLLLLVTETCPEILSLGKKTTLGVLQNGRFVNEDLISVRDTTSFCKIMFLS